MGRNGRAALTAVLLAGAALATACSAGGAQHRSATPSPTAPARHSVSAPAPPTVAPSTSVHSSVRRSAVPRPTHRRTSVVAPRTSLPPATRKAAPPKPRALPLEQPTGNATQVLTVTAAATSSTQGTLQAWRKVDGGWRKVGGAVAAWLGSDGLSRHPSESRSATPIGSFTLTRAFGRDADPGTALPYLRTTPADWWISESGSLYNTHQRCSSDCAFARDAPNEHLYYETPYYDYAVVIDYNTHNAPGGVEQGAGSAFFLHVTDQAPTQGCVSIARDQLVRLLGWLTPSHHPRILIGID